ncbi:MAG: hypothetical protein SPL13_04730 [Clostridia bacterium]|nr:hypothetical protein [Clostridia bacterium]
MLGKSIGVIDSGVGGISLLVKLNNALNNETFIYCGDNKNVPYGNKSYRELLSLASSMVIRLLPYKPKCIILGCNTLSLTVRKDIEDFAGVPVFGVFPPIENELILGRKTILLATERTCDFYKKISKRLSLHDKKSLTIIPQKNLASETEKFYTSFQNNRTVNNENSCLTGKNFLNKAGESFYCFDSVVLGCTHYEFIKMRLKSTLLTTDILSGEENTVNAVKLWEKESKNEKNDSKNKVIFIGGNSTQNKKLFNSLTKTLI